MEANKITTPPGFVLEGSQIPIPKGFVLEPQIAKPPKQESPYKIKHDTAPIEGIPPFNLDTPMWDWASTRDQEEFSAMDDVGSALYPAFQKFARWGETTQSAFNRALGNIATHFDLIDQWAAEKSGGVLKSKIPWDKAADYFEQNAEEWAKLASDKGADALDQFVGDFLGSMVPGTLEFSFSLLSGLTYPYSVGAAKARMKEENEVVNGLVEAMKTGTLGAIFKIIHPLQQYLRAPLMGTTFGAQAVGEQLAETGEIDLSKVAESIATGVGFSYLSPGGRMGLNEVASNLRNSYLKLDKDRMVKEKPVEKPKLEGLEELRKEQREKEQAGKVVIPQPQVKPQPFEFVDKTAEKNYQESLPKKESHAQKLKDVTVELFDKMTRTYENLPNKPEFAEIKFALKKLEKQRGVAANDATLKISEVLSSIKDKEAYDIFTRKVILEDLKRELDMGHDVPWGFNKNTVASELMRLDSEIASRPEVKSALDKRTQIWDTLKQDYITTMKDIGFDVSYIEANEAYFRHQVLEHINLKNLREGGKKVRTPTNRGYLRNREGAKLDINRDFLEPEFEVMSKMHYDIQLANTIKLIDEKYNIADQVRKNAKSKNLVDWREAIPDTHDIWQPREGNVFYMVDSIPGKLAEKLYTQALAKIDITEADLSRALALGQPRKQYVLPKEVINTLKDFEASKKEGIISSANREVVKGWKVWQLISPRRYAKYNFRNLTGDADAAFVGNPRGFLKVPEAAKELVDMFINKKQMTPEFREWYERGGMESNLQAQEMGALKQLWTFERLYKEENPHIKDIPARVWKKYWRTARISTDMRESLLRYANYLDYLEQMKSDPQGRPKNFGASKEKDVMALSDIRDRAYWLSNDLLGAYDNVSVMGQNLRKYWFPFWSWKEVNFKRYIQFAKNAANDGNLSQMVGNKLLGTAVRSPFIAARVGKFVLSATALWSALHVWNNTMFPEEEAELSDEERARPHIIFGRTADGEIINFIRLGALGDFLDWFGLGNTPKFVDKYLKGEMSIKEIAIEMVKSPVDVIAQGLTPQVKVPAEVALRQSTFPDVFSPKPIRDRWYYLFNHLGLGEEYKSIAGLPTKGYKESLHKFFVYSTDPGQVAYSEVQDMKRRWLDKEGKGAEGFWLTPKGNALYNFKLAIKYGDKEAIQKYLSEYISLGGNLKGMEESMKRMHPLSGLSKKDQDIFLASLSKDELNRYEKALEFYYKTFEF